MFTSSFDTSLQENIIKCMDVGVSCEMGMAWLGYGRGRECEYGQGHKHGRELAMSMCKGWKEHF